MNNNLTLGIYGNGQLVYNECIKEEYIEKYDKIAEEFYLNNNVNMYQPTIPYR